jgi:HEPN domain-containing protein
MTPNEPKPATAEARALLRAAERDSKTVELLLQHPDAPISSVCFHAQQYMEKAMKAKSWLICSSKKRSSRRCLKIS